MKKNCSPNIVQYKEDGLSEAKDVFWIIMEKLQGFSMDKKIGIQEIEALQVPNMIYCFLQKEKYLIDLSYRLESISVQL